MDSAAINLNNTTYNAQINGFFIIIIQNKQALDM